MMRVAQGAELSDGRVSRPALRFYQGDGGNRRKSYLFFLKKLFLYSTLTARFTLDDGNSIIFRWLPFKSSHGEQAGRKKQLRRKLTREQAHYAATATCYLCRGCERPASPPGTELCDWTSRKLEAGLYISAMLAIGHSPTPVIHCPGPLYDKLKLVNSRFANKNINETCRCDPEQDLQDIIREVDVHAGGL